MSGPKGYDYALSQQLQRERERAERRRQWDQIAAQIAARAKAHRREGIEADVKREMAKAGYDASRLSRPTEADIDALPQLIAAWQQVTAIAVEAETRHRVSQASAALDGLRASLADTPFVATRLSTRAATPTTAAVAAPHEFIPERLGDVLELLAELDDPTLRDDLAERIRTIAADRSTSDNSRRKTWLALTTEVAVAVREVRELAAMQPLAAELRALLGAVDEPLSSSLAARINSARDRVALESIRPDLLAAMAETRARSEREYVIWAALESWRELGYEPDAGFVEATLAGRPALLFHQDWDGHALQVRVDPDSSAIATNVVALGESTADRDREVEEDHCADITPFREQLDALGVEAELVRAQPAGAVSVQHLDRAHPKAVTRRAAEATTEEASRDS